MRTRRNRPGRLPLPVFHDQTDLCNSSSLNLTNEVQFPLTANEVIHIRADNMRYLYQLGSGHYATVDAMRHEPSQHVFAVKKLPLSTEVVDEKRLLRDLHVSLRSAACEFVIRCYVALLHEGEVWIVMEFMDLSLEKFYKRIYQRHARSSMALEAGGLIPESILVYICFCVVTALEHLHIVANIIHRDVKPSNILVDLKGFVKICDFGISGELVNSLALSHVGCEQYLSPERIAYDSSHNDGTIQGYDIRADVWSLGLTLLELATGVYPYGPWANVFVHYRNVVEQPAPQLPAQTQYSVRFQELIGRCLQKAVKDRATYCELLQLPLLKQVSVYEGQQEMSQLVRQLLRKNKASLDPGGVGMTL